ncbi:MAG: hypothetical protein BJ554DRAFT_1339 [Olpidium bornovanus]|uniref:ubiquitinyl hydrolase 1 n=1 Tax=Olpidium bornovanus TaxID=278681 RepID=A0A8H7ZSH3_9FUNG|nr:MAG: hypothetical protein BJ554DRAFT_1339 [Olpidium bornovanus]
MSEETSSRKPLLTVLVPAPPGQKSPVPVEKVFTHFATLQTMVARAPRILAVHLARSSYDSYGGAKKNDAAVAVPARLDLAPFCTPGVDLSPSPSTELSREGVVYELSAAVCHYGPHDSGHFTAYCRRRRPLPAARKRRREGGADGPPDTTSGKLRQGMSFSCGGDPEAAAGATGNEERTPSCAREHVNGVGSAAADGPPAPDAVDRTAAYADDSAGNDEWFEISDETVSRVDDIEAAMRRSGRAVYMVFYEAAAEPRRKQTIPGESRIMCNPREV